MTSAPHFANCIALAGASLLPSVAALVALVEFGSVGQLVQPRGQGDGDPAPKRDVVEEAIALSEALVAPSRYTVDAAQLVSEDAARDCSREFMAVFDEISESLNGDLSVEYISSLVIKEWRRLERRALTGDPDAQVNNLPLLFNKIPRRRVVVTEDVVLDEVIEDSSGRGYSLQATRHYTLDYTPKNRQLTFFRSGLLGVLDLETILFPMMARPAGAGFADPHSWTQWLNNDWMALSRQGDGAYPAYLLVVDRSTHRFPVAVASVDRDSTTWTCIQYDRSGDGDSPTLGWVVSAEVSKGSSSRTVCRFNSYKLSAFERGAELVDTILDVQSGVHGWGCMGPGSMVYFGVSPDGWPDDGCEYLSVDGQRLGRSWSPQYVKGTADSGSQSPKSMALWAVFAVVSTATLLAMRKVARHVRAS